MLNLRLLTIFLSSTILCSCVGHYKINQSSPRAQKLLALGFVPVPMTKPNSKDSRPGVPVRVNGVSDTLLVDSGANSTRISREYANRAKIKAHNKYHATSRGALGRAVKVQQGTGKLAIGPLSLQPYNFTIVNLSTRTTASGRFPGHIGAESLKLSSSLVDLSSNTLWVPLKPASFAQNGRLQPIGYQAGLGVVTREIQSANSYYHMLLTGKIHGKKVVFMIDTGAEISLLTYKAAARLRLPVSSTHIAMVDAHGDRTQLGATIAETAYFGDFTAKQIPFSVAKIGAFSHSNLRSSNGQNIDGILGVDFLRQSFALIDASSRLIYFGKP